MYTLGNILPKVSSYILLPIYTRYLTPSEYGIVNSMGVLNIALAVFFSLSLERAIMRLYWDYESEEKRRDFLGTIALAVAGIATVILCTLFLMHKYVGMIYKGIEFFPYFALAILLSYFQTYSLVPKKYLLLKGKSGIFIGISAFETIINAGFILWFVVGTRSGAVGFLQAQLLGSVIFIPVFLYMIYNNTNLHFHIDTLKSALSFSLPIIPSILAAWVLNMSDRIFIERYFDLNMVGIYSLGYKIAGLVLLVTGGFGMAYAPEFFRLANSKNQVKARKKISEYNHVNILLIIMVCFGIAFFSKEVITVLFDKRYIESYQFTLLISFSYLFSAATGITSKFFQQSKKMMQNAGLSIFAGGINIILNFTLIPPYGAFGAAYATIISMAITFYISYFFARKYCYFVPINWRKILPVIGILVLLVVTFQYLIVFDILLTIIIKMSIMFILGFVFIKKYYYRIRLIIIKG